jgi:hypothetical protein
LHPGVAKRLLPYYDLYGLRSAASCGVSFPSLVFTFSRFKKKEK